ncbi:MAG: TonB-dependent siderophore receptor [Halieaceae bacterium]|nr:TonB-dependent siderophore receptor [Halieaceae bacterium]
MNHCNIQCVLRAITLAAVAASAGTSNAENSNESLIEETIVRGSYLQSSEVNALRTPTPILDVPQSLSIVTSEEILRRGFTSVSDIIEYLPGVSMSQGEGHRDAVVFRGVRSTADFFIDGVRDDVQYYRPLYNLEQLEVLRGPNALLFGRGGTGGILNRVTKKANIGENFSQLSGYVDSFGAGGLQGDVNIGLNDTVAFRINAMAEGLDNHRDHYDGEQVGINPTVRVLLSEATRLDVSYEYVDQERFIDRGIPTGSNGDPVERFDRVVFGDPDVNLTSLEAHIFIANLQHRFSDSMKGQLTAFYGDYDKLYQNFYAASYSESNSPDVVTLDGYVDTTQRENLIFSGNLIKELAFAGMSHRFLLGAEYVDTSSNQDRWNTYWSETADDRETFMVTRPMGVVGGSGINALGAQTVNDFTVDLNDDTRVGIEVTSVYVQDEMALTESMDLVLGARFDQFEIDVFNLPASESRSKRDEEVSPRMGVVYKPLQNMSLYASYSESFLPRSGEQFANINGSKNQLDADTFANTELGFKWDISSSLSFTAAIFEIEQESPQVADSDPDTLDVIKSETDGFELQLEGQITDAWYLSAAYSYLDGEQMGRSGPKGLRPRELPENMFSVWNFVQFTANLGMGIGLTYQDESFINNSNTARLPSYTRVDAAIYYEWSDDWRIQLNVENLGDTEYYPSSHSTHQATVGAPFNARIAITKDF